MAYSKEDKKEIIDRVCNYIVEKKASLKSALELHSTPNRDTFYQWIKENKDFSDKYARACKDRADDIFEDIIEIADDESDIYFDDNGNKRVDSAAVQKKRAKIDARKWMLSKMNPKKYGDRIDVTSDNEPLSMTREEREQRIKELIQKANVK